MKIREEGNASFTCDLSNGVITIKHGSCNSILYQWTANEGDWNKIFKIIKKLEEK